MKEYVGTGFCQTATISHGFVFSLFEFRTVRLGSDPMSEESRLQILVERERAQHECTVS